MLNQCRKRSDLQRADAIRVLHHDSGLLRIQSFKFTGSKVSNLFSFSVPVDGFADYSLNCPSGPLGFPEPSSAECGTIKVRSYKTSFHEYCFTEACLLTYCLPEVCPVKICLAECCPAEICRTKVSSAKICPAEICPSEIHHAE